LYRVERVIKVNSPTPGIKTLSLTNSNSSIISEGYLLLLSPTDITLGQYERCHFPLLARQQSTHE
jgi:hypothetical protein